MQRRDFVKTVGAGLAGFCAADLHADLIAAPPNQKAAADLDAFIDGFISPARSQASSDLSAASFARELAETRRMLGKLRAIDPAGLDVDDRIDRSFAESILVGRELQQGKMQPWKKDPRVYMTFRSIPTAIGRPGDLAQKSDTVLRLVSAVPAQLQNGRVNLAVYVQRFQELSVFMAEGARNIFDKTVPEFAASSPKRVQLLEASRQARRTLDEYIAFLKTDLPRRPVGDWAIGRATYDEMLHGQYLLTNYNADTLYKYGLDQFNRTVQKLEQVALTIDPKKTWRQLADEIKQDQPDPMKMIEAHQQWVDKARAHVIGKNLVPIPWKERAMVVPRPEYLRKTSYYGDTAVGKSLDKDGVFVSHWEINPFEPQWDAKTKQEYMVEHDWGVIIDTAPHEMYPGHHIQGMYQFYNARKLRKTYNISIFTEGWGLYTEILMQETGFLPSEKIHLRQLQLLLWRNARVVWDVGIHTGQMSYDDAVSLLADRVGFLRWAAQLEVDGSAQAPGYRIGYFMGMSEILRMRDEFKQRRGARFTLADFHERLLKVGSMPPSLVREGLMASLDHPTA